jgi:hypothetical protein
MAVKSLWQRTTALDRVVVVCLLGLSGALFLVFGLHPAGQSIQVLQDSDAIYQAPLDRDTEAELRGPLGATRLVINDGEARVTSSPCPYKVCISMGAISRRDEIIACVPNRLLVRVVGKGEAEKETGYDLLSR